MADAKQVEVLKQGTLAWNQWRLIHPEVKIDLSNITIFKADFRGADLDGADFSNALLHGPTTDKGRDGVDFSGAKLRRATLYKTILLGVDLSGADLSGAVICFAQLNGNLQGVNLSYANLRDANLRGSNLFKARLHKANLCGANLTEVNLYMVNLSKIDLRRANLTDANLSKTNLSGANLSGADLTGANLSEANLLNTNLQYVRLVKAKLSGASMRSCRVYGLSSWDLKGIPKEQSKLIITDYDQLSITVDDLQVAQFIYLLLNNQNIRSVIDTITSKVVLILGRFTEKRKEVLDAIREKLHTLNLTPIIFDFDKPDSKDLTGTIETLARMARFIIADLTDPSSIPHELATVIPFLRTTPVLPMRLQGAVSYTMFDDFRRDLPHRVLKTYEYKDNASLIAALSEVIAPANEMAEAFRSRLYSD